MQKIIPQKDIKQVKQFVMDEISDTIGSLSWPYTNIVTQKNMDKIAERYSAKTPEGIAIQRCIKIWNIIQNW